MLPHRPSHIPRIRESGQPSRVAGSGTVAIGLLLYAAMVPSASSAQACLGTPTLPGEVAVGARADFADGATGYGATVLADFPGALTLGASIGQIDLAGAGEDAKLLGGTAAYEIHAQRMSACPVLGVGRSSFATRAAGVDTDHSTVWIPIGVGLGTRIQTQGTLVIIPSGVLGVQRTWRTIDGVSSGQSVAERVVTNDLFLDGGATVARGRIHARLGLARTFEPGSETVVSTGAGFRF